MTLGPLNTPNPGQVRRTLSFGVKRSSAGLSLALTRQLTPEATRGGSHLIEGPWKKVAKKALLVVLTSGLLMGSAEAAALRWGDSGSDVALLQERLQSLGYSVGGADGAFGSQTEAAVKAIQADRGLEADGIVGEATWSVLRLPGTPVSRGRGDSIAVSRILATAKRHQGVPYLWGGTTPNGFDCSGFTQYVFGLNGISLPRTADVQFGVGQPVTRSQLQPGDLVFFSTYEPGPSHNGIYLGDGKFISASSSRGIAIDRLDSSYWGPRYIGARRVLR